jgi:hypothetical protein
MAISEGVEAMAAGSLAWARAQEEGFRRGEKCGIGIGEGTDGEGRWRQRVYDWIGESVSGRRDDGAGRGRETTARGENGTEKSHPVPYRFHFLSDRFHIMKKMETGTTSRKQQTESKTGEVFSVCISGNPFWVRIVLYFIFFWIKQEFQVTGQEVMEHEYITKSVLFPFLWLPND